MPRRMTRRCRVCRGVGHNITNCASPIALQWINTNNDFFRTLARAHESGEISYSVACREIFGWFQGKTAEEIGIIARQYGLRAYYPDLYTMIKHLGNLFYHDVCPIECQILSWNVVSVVLIYETPPILTNNLDDIYRSVTDLDTPTDELGITLATAFHGIGSNITEHILTNMLRTFALGNDIRTYTIIDTARTLIRLETEMQDIFVMIDGAIQRRGAAEGAAGAAGLVSTAGAAVQWKVDPVVLCTETAEELAVESECPICYDIRKCSDYIVCNCTHSFCNTCITTQLEKQKPHIQPTCAMCREPIRTVYISDVEIYNTFTKRICNLV